MASSGIKKKASHTPKKTSALRITDADYREEERELLFTYLEKEVIVEQLKDFLEECELPRSGTKSELVQRLRGAIDEGTLDHSDLVSLLDKVLPWSSQHVFLFTEPPKNLAMQQYRNKQRFEALLAEHKASRPLRTSLPIILPEKLTVASIEHEDEKLRVTAVERRDGYMRKPELDNVVQHEGEDVEMRAFVKMTTRGLIVFEWNFVTNLAMMQITTLPSHEKYEDAKTRFEGLVKKWIDVSQFPGVDLRNGIRTLHDEAIEMGDESRARPHGVGYDTEAGSFVEATSAAAQTSLLSDETARDAMEIARMGGTGRTGNFYWREAPDLPEGHRGVHFKMLARRARIHFPTRQTEGVLRHVLDGIRDAC